jgi:hypothetical protein
MADTQRVVELITTIANDPALRDRLAQADEADRSAILAELGYSDVSPADVAASAHQFVPQVVEEIDDDQLATVAGGVDDTVIVATVTTATPPAAASAAVAT